MDPIPFCLAIGPVAIYLLGLAIVNLSRRPRIVSGVRDAAALAFALTGLMIVGPMRMLFPMEVAIRTGGAYMWLWLLAPYGMLVIVWLLTLRPRLVIYNMSVDKLRPVLADVAAQLDPTARWAGDSVAMPAIGVQLYLDSFVSLGSVSLCSAGANQNQAGWRRLEVSLRSALAREEYPRGTRGLTLLVLGFLCAAAIAWVVSRNPDILVEPLSGAVRPLLKSVGL